MNGRLQLGLLGAGTMAAHHARVVSESAVVDLSVVVDTDQTRATQLTESFGGRPSTQVEDVAGCDLVIVATPTESHADIALSLLQEGTPLLIEKPISNDIPAVEEVIASARERDVPIMCGFVERFNPVIISAAELMHGPPLHVVSLRHSPPAPRVSTSVVYDLLIHDIDLALRYAGSQEIADISGSKWAPEGTPYPEIADCTLQFDGGMIATLSASRMGQRKIRTYYVATHDRFIEIDLLRQDISVYKHVAHQQVAGDTTTYRAETIIDIPFVRQIGEPLALQLNHFVVLARGEIDPEAERATVLAPHVAAARLTADP